MKMYNLMTGLGAAAAMSLGATAGELLASDASMRVYAVSSLANPDRGDTFTVTFFADITGGAMPADVSNRIGLSYDFSIDFAGLDYIGGSIADASSGIFDQPALGLGTGTLRAAGVLDTPTAVGNWPAAGLPLFSAQFSLGASALEGTYSVAPRNNTLAESLSMILLGPTFVEPAILLDNDVVIGSSSPSFDDEFASNAVTFDAFTFEIVDGCNPADLAEAFGTLDINDILIFATAFNSMAPTADFFADGMFDINDILVFAGFFNAGCPGAVIFEETFEGLPRQNAVSPTEQPGTNVWGNVPPAGWTVNNAGVPANGVPEFTGWTFLDRAWWDLTSAQNRGMFTRGMGTIAVADSDEWADGPGEAPGTFNTLMSTPQIDISGRAANSLQLTFDSSWRPEGAQAAAVLVSYDGGAFTEVFALNSGNTTDNGANLNQEVIIPLNNPAASTVQVRFDYLNGSNNWWWAIDNVRLLTQ